MYLLYFGRVSITYVFIMIKVTLHGFLHKSKRITFHNVDFMKILYYLYYGLFCDCKYEVVAFDKFGYCK